MASNPAWGEHTRDSINTVLFGLFNFGFVTNDHKYSHLFLVYYIVRISTQLLICFVVVVVVIRSSFIYSNLLYGMIHYFSFYCT